MKKEFVFRVSPLEGRKIEGQIAAILEKRTELISREQHPKMWMLTDKMNKDRSQEALRRISLRSKIYGTVLLINGLALSLPFLAEAGKFWHLILIGVVSLLFSAAFFSFGSSGTSGKKTSFDKAARKLMDRPESLIGEELRFVREGLFAKEEGIAYKDFEFFFETGDLFAVTSRGRLLLLKKEDLCETSSEDFVRFIREVVPKEKVVDLRRG
ncbi:hypothetical protein [Filifactor villosus]|uniref:YcxB-like protein domain-containing protein n=1 Tax=Filifactor villosus TaxID=29374 RepID=A0ABV9QIC4_9FIRM